jgi:hypothetical protein
MVRNAQLNVPIYVPKAILIFFCYFNSYGYELSTRIENPRVGGWSRSSHLPLQATFPTKLLAACVDYEELFADRFGVLSFR